MIINQQVLIFKIIQGGLNDSLKRQLLLIEIPKL